MSHFQKLVAISLLFSIFLQSCNDKNSQLRNYEQAELGIRKDQSLQGTPYGSVSIAEHTSGTHRDGENMYLMFRSDSLLGASHDSSKPEASDLLSDVAPSICRPALLPKASPEFSVDQLGHIVLGKDALEKRVPLCSPANVLSEALSVVGTTDNGYGPFMLSSDNEVTFSRERGKWQAIVKNNWLVREECFPVACAGDVAAILSDLQDARAVDVLHRIHIQKPGHPSRYVYVGALGVKGGMAKKKKKKPSASPSVGAALGAEPAYTSHICLNPFDLEWSLDRIEVYRRRLLDCGEMQYDLASEHLEEEEELHDRARRHAFLWDIQMARNGYEQFIYQLSKSIGNLRNDPSAVTDILLWLLRCREEYLLNREESIQRWVIWDYQSSASIVPMGDLLFGIQTINSSEKEKIINNLSREISVRTFELQNELICSLFVLYKQNLGNQKQGQTISKLLIDATQLHPLLEGKVSELGHPDKCTYLHKFEILLQGMDPMLLDKMTRIENIKDAGKRADKSKKLLKGVFEKMFAKQKLQKRYNKGEDDLNTRPEYFIDFLTTGCVDPHYGNIVATMLLRVIHNHTDCFSEEASRVWAEAKSEFEPYTETSESAEPGENLLLNFLKPDESVVGTEITEWMD